MAAYELAQKNLLETQYTWLVTGVAGFIGSNLLESLLSMGQRVVGLDNFSTGYRRNLDEVKNSVANEEWDRFTFIEGDIRNLKDCHMACDGVDIVLHQAALGSVPRSIDDPIMTNDCNVNGFLNMLVACRDAGVKRFVYAASSSTYGDYQGLPKTEDKIGKPLSPYAVTKYVNELYAEVFVRNYSIETVGLRYFNVFGRRQDPNGAYAAVIPKWISTMINGDSVTINGDGQTSRDFCYVDNVVQANILAGTTKRNEAINQVYNVAVGESTSLNCLFSLLCNALSKNFEGLDLMEPVYGEFRSGDVLHSLADISKAAQLLGYGPSHRIGEGLEEAIGWYLKSNKDM